MNITTITDLEEAIIKLQQQRDIFMLSKKSYELELSTLNARVRSRTTKLSTKEYNDICKRQDYLKNSISNLQPVLTDYKNKIAEKTILKERVRNEMKFKNDKSVSNTDKIVLLKDKYREFASDQSRISSMRIMASKFCEELDELLTNN